MKLKSLFIAAIASVVAFAGCQQKEDVYSKEPSVELSQKTFELTKEAQSFTFTLAATRDWKIETTADWIVFEPSEGAASLDATTITATVTSNEGKNRNATVNVKAGLASDAISVAQAGPEGGLDPIAEGDGTLAKPYTASQAHAVAAALADGATTPDKVYVRGIIHKLASKHADGVSQYGNGSFYISDSGEASDDDFYCFQVYYLGGKKFTSADQVKVGDDVIIYGQLTNYSGTYETVGKGAAYVYSLNGETDGGGDVPPVTGDITDATAAEFIAAAVDANKLYRLKGTVVGPINTTYGNFDIKDETGQVYVYGTSNWSEYKDKFAEGGNVVFVGTRGDYNGKVEVLNGYIESYDGDGGGSTIDPSEYENAAAKSVADFLSAADAATYYKLTGTISSYGAATCRFDLTDATGTVYVYSVKNASDWSAKMHNGGTVTLAGKYQFYEAGNQEEVVDAFILSYDASTEVPVEGLEHSLTSAIKWTLGTNSYDNTCSGNNCQSATVNGEAVDNLLKLSTSKAAGSATLTIPSGVTKIGFYACGWAAADITVGSKTVSVKKNAGCTGNAPYTLELTDANDYYEVEVSAGDVTVSCPSRVLLIGINAL